MSNQSKMMLSIIIPTYNTSELTLACIESLKLYPSQYSHEIIIVDNNSSDDTCVRISQRFPDVRRCRNDRNLGFSKACNKGALASTGSYLCFLNSDTEAKGEALDTLLDWLTGNPGTGIVAPELISPQKTILQMSWGWNPILAGELMQQYFAPYALRRSALRRKWVQWLQRRPRQVPYVPGACLVIKRVVFDQLKGYDENYELYFEDADMCLRAHQAGWEIEFVPTSKVIHHLGQSTKGSWGLTPLVYRQSQIYYYRKHASRAVPILKIYLGLKWFIVWCKCKRAKDSSDQINHYLKRFKSVIFENSKLFLSDFS